jgi:hypothetical protein
MNHAYHTPAHSRLPFWVRELMHSPPQAGGGFHQWLFRTAIALRQYWPESEISAFLTNAAMACGRLVPTREIADAIDASGRVSTTAKRSSLIPSPKKRQSLPDEQLIAQTLRAWDGYTLADLWEDSLIRLDENSDDADSIVSTLFPNDSLLCCGKDNANFDTRPLKEWIGELAKLQLIVPSPMTHRHGQTKTGKLSTHSLDNTGPRRFLVVEFDSGTQSGQAALLRHLGTIAPLVAVVHSGNKSLHGWFYCATTPEATIRAFFDHAIHLGADPMTWTRSQFVRMPGGCRSDGRLQRLHYFNPTHIRQ